MARIFFNSFWIVEKTAYTRRAIIVAWMRGIIYPFFRMHWQFCGRFTLPCQRCVCRTVKSSSYYAAAASRLRCILIFYWSARILKYCTVTNLIFVKCRQTCAFCQHFICCRICYLIRISNYLLFSEIGKEIVLLTQFHRSIPYESTLLAISGRNLLGACPVPLIMSIC